jgi:hypothetical protein
LKLRYLAAAFAVLMLLVVSSRLGLWVVVAVVVPPFLLLNILTSRDLGRSVEARCRELRELSFDALAAMQEVDRARSLPVGPVFMGPCVASIEVLLEPRPPDSLRIVVRGSTDLLGGTLERFCGFYKSRDGAVLPVPSREFDAIPDRGFEGID